VATARALRRAFHEQTVALFALPAYPGARLSPDASGLLQCTLELLLTVLIDVAGVAVGPFAELGGVSRALDAANVAALVAGGGGRGDEQGVALVAGAADTLLRGLVGQLSARLGRDGQQLLLLGGDGAFLLLLLALVTGGPLLGVAGAFLAALVLALGADFVGAVRVSAVVAGAVDAHADGLLDTLHVDGFGGRGDPLVRLQGQAVLCKQRAGSLLLEGAAVELLGDWVGALGHGGGGGGGGGGLGRGSRTVDGQCLYKWDFPMRNVRRRSFLLLRFVDGGRRGGRGQRAAAGLGLGLVRLLAAEDAAHALDIFAQALLGVGGWGGSGRRHGDGSARRRIPRTNVESRKSDVGCRKARGSQKVVVVFSGQTCRPGIPGIGCWAD
jgi:hypothetical protein